MGWAALCRDLHPVCAGLCALRQAPCRVLGATQQQPGASAVCPHGAGSGRGKVRKRERRTLASEECCQGPGVRDSSRGLGIWAEAGRFRNYFCRTLGTCASGRGNHQEQGPEVGLRSMCCGSWRGLLWPECKGLMWDWGQEEGSEGQGLLGLLGG